MKVEYFLHFLAEKTTAKEINGFVNEKVKDFLWHGESFYLKDYFSKKRRKKEMSEYFVKIMKIIKNLKLRIILFNLFIWPRDSGISNLIHNYWNRSVV